MYDNHPHCIPLSQGPSRLQKYPMEELNVIFRNSWLNSILISLSVLVSQHTKVLCRVIVCNWEMRDQSPQQIIAVSHGRLKWSKQGHSVNGKPPFKQSIDNTSRILYLFLFNTTKIEKLYLCKMKMNWKNLYLFQFARSWQPPGLLQVCNTPN